MGLLRPPAWCQHHHSRVFVHFDRPGAAASTGSPSEELTKSSEIELEEGFNLRISCDEFVASLEYAQDAVSDPVADPEAFEAAVDECIEAELVLETGASTGESSAVDPGALPAGGGRRQDHERGA